MPLNRGFASCANGASSSPAIRGIGVRGGLEIGRITAVDSGAPGQPTPEGRIRWFEEYVERLQGSSVTAGAGEAPFACPCCGYLTLDERGGFEICAVCFWEDDGQDERDAEVVRGGPNGGLSLRDAQRNFDRVGACEERHIYHVRPPEPGEVPTDGSGRVLPEAARIKRRPHRFQT